MAEGVHGSTECREVRRQRGKVTAFVRPRQHQSRSRMTANDGRHGSRQQIESFDGMEASDENNERIVVREIVSRSDVAWRDSVWHVHTIGNHDYSFGTEAGTQRHGFRLGGGALAGGGRDDAATGA